MNSWERAKASERTTSRKVETERAKSEKCMRDLSQHQFNEQRFLLLIGVRYFWWRQVLDLVLRNSYGLK